MGLSGGLLRPIILIAASQVGGTNVTTNVDLVGLGLRLRAA